MKNKAHMLVFPDSAFRDITEEEQKALDEISKQYDQPSKEEIEECMKQRKEYIDSAEIEYFYVNSDN